VFIPVAAFAKSASGEPHRSLIPSKVTQSTTSTGDLTITATTDAPCSSPTIINSTPFSSGDKVTVTASLADVNDPSENTENEPLLVFDTGGVFKQTIPVDTGSHTFPTFTATAGDTLEACITGDGPDGDESGTISATVTTPTPAPTPIPTQLQLPQVPHSISGKQLLRFVGLLLTIGRPGLISTPCDKLLTANGNAVGAVLFECLESIHDIIDLVNEGKLPLPFSQFFIFSWQALQIECQNGVQSACQQLFGSPIQG